VALIGTLALGLIAVAEPTITRDHDSLGMVGLGILGVVVLAVLLGRGMWQASAFAVVAILAGGPLALIVSSPHMSSWAGMVLVLFVGLALGVLTTAAPALILCCVYGRRYDLGAGDDLVGGLGVYWLVGQLFELWCLGWPAPRGSLQIGVCVLSAVVAVSAVVVSLIRGHLRRGFCLRALHGEAAGFRVRAPLTTSEVSSVPAIFASKKPPDTVLLRVAPPHSEPQTSRAVAAFASSGLAARKP
jgi:hypothetical protein